MQETKEHIMSLHILRGIAVILMIITHVWIVLFWNVENQVGSIMSFVGGYLSFTIFLFISGFLLGHKYSELNLVKILERSGIILLAYLFLGAVYIITHRQSVGYIFTAPIYLQEYLLTLAIMPIAGYFGVVLLRKFHFLKNILKHHTGAFFFCIAGLLLVIAGKWAAMQNTNFYISLLFGSANYHTFPIISYAIIYGVGGWLGWARRTDNNKDFYREAFIFTLLAVIITAISVPFENITFTVNALDKLRWPPTVFFIFSTLGIGITLLLVCLNFEIHSRKFPLNLLGAIGKNSLQLVVLHILILFILEPYFVLIATIPKVDAGKVDPSKSFGEQFIESVEDTFENVGDWPFLGSKAALITSSRDLAIGPAYIEVNPLEIGTSLSSNDVALYTASQDEKYSKVDFSITLATTGQYYINFTVPENTSRLAVAFTDDPSIPSHDGLDQMLKNPGNPQGEKLQVIDKNFTNWAYKNFSIQSKKWVVKDPRKATENIRLTVSFPFYCLELAQFAESGYITFDVPESSVVNMKKCKQVTVLQTKLPVAHSQFELEVLPGNLIAKTGKISIPVQFGMYLDEQSKKYTLERKVAVSEPMYVFWSLDWEGLQANKASMDTLDSIRGENPNLKMTHQFNPRIWNTGAISRSSAESQIAYVKDKVSKYGDEAGVHLHMYVDMVTKAEVTPIAAPAWGYRTDGYDVPFSEYGYEDSRKILNWAVDEFRKKGLPRPTSIRAGGWFMDMDNLRALKDEGFLVDTSGRTRYTSRSFGTGPSIPGFWTLVPTAQPYWISRSDQNKVASSKTSRLGIFEIPNNGGDSWAFNPDAMIGRFKDIYSSEVLDSHKTVVFLTHPDFLNKEGPKIQQVLRHVRYYANYADSGPVIYITMKEYYELYAK